MGRGKKKKGLQSQNQSEKTPSTSHPQNENTLAIVARHAGELLRFLLNPRLSKGIGLMAWAATGLFSSKGPWIVFLIAGAFFFFSGVLKQSGPWITKIIFSLCGISAVSFLGWQFFPKQDLIPRISARMIVPQDVQLSVNHVQVGNKPRINVEMTESFRVGVNLQNKTEDLIFERLTLTFQVIGCKIVNYNGWFPMTPVSQDVASAFFVTGEKQRLAPGPIGADFAVLILSCDKKRDEFEGQISLSGDKISAKVAKEMQYPFALIRDKSTYGSVVNNQERHIDDVPGLRKQLDNFYLRHRTQKITIFQYPEYEEAIHFQRAIGNYLQYEKGANVELGLCKIHPPIKGVRFDESDPSKPSIIVGVNGP